MAIDPKIIKHKEVLIDQTAGTATVNITIYSKRRGKVRDKVYTNHVIPLVVKAGVEITDVIQGCRIHNLYGEATGTWIFEITSVVKKPLAEKKTPIKKQKPVKKVESKKAEPKKEESKKAEPKKEESSSGFFAKRDKKKGNK